MSKSQQLLIASVILGIGAAIVAYIALPAAHWAALLVIVIVVAALSYAGLLKQRARETILDRKDRL